MEFLRSVLAQDESVTASTRVTYDLPVNPLSHILFTLKFLNDTGTLTNYTIISAALAQISNLAVEFKGSSVLNGSFADLAILSQLLLRKPVNQVNLARTNNDVRSITVALPFGRKLFNPKECFPAVRRGDLRLVIDYAAAQTGIDGLVAQIETVELLGAQPGAYMKVTTSAKTLTSGVGNDVDLPIGNPIVGCLLFGTTVPNTAYTSTIERVKVLVDNVESHYSEANWESMVGEFLHRFPLVMVNETHVHENQESGSTAQSTLGPENDVGQLDNYAYLDFDPCDDGEFLLQTEGKSRVHLRITAGASDAARVLPIELIKVSG